MNILLSAASNTCADILSEVFFCIYWVREIGNLYRKNEDESMIGFVSQKAIRGFCQPPPCVTSDWDISYFLGGGGPPTLRGYNL